MEIHEEKNGEYIPIFDIENDVGFIIISVQAGGLNKKNKKM